MASTGPIRFGIGRYTLQRGQLKRERGEESPWRTPRASPEQRAELVAAVREQIARRRAIREGSTQFSPHEARTLWRRADHRPALYRHILLQRLRTDTAKLELPCWASKLTDAAIDAAKDMFHDAWQTGQGCTADSPPGLGRTADTTGSTPGSTWKTYVNDTGQWFKNPLRRSPSVPTAEFRHTMTTADSSRAMRTSSTTAAFEPRAANWCVDSGAGAHPIGMTDLTSEEQRTIKPLDYARYVLTANGRAEITGTIELALKTLGATLEITAEVLPDMDGPCLSVNELCMKDGYSFYWTPSGPHLVTPKGKHIYLPTPDNTPHFNCQQQVINKCNELEAYARINAAKSLPEPADATPGTHTPGDTTSADDVTGPFFLEVFAGTGRLSSRLERDLAAVGRQDVKVIRIEWKDNPDDNLLESKCFIRIQRLINSGKCLGVWFAPPCNSWSTSRRHDGKGAPPLRSIEHPYGLPSLRAKDRNKVLEANTLMRRTSELATTCILNRVPFVVENPYHSMIWLTTEFRHLAGLPGVLASRVDFCQYGEPYHKKI